MYRRAYAAPQRGCLCVAPRLRRAMLRLPVPRLRRAMLRLPVPRLRRAEFFVRRAYGGVPQRGCLCEVPRLRRAMLRLPVPRLRRARWCWLHLLCMDERCDV